MRASGVCGNHEVEQQPGHLAPPESARRAVLGIKMELFAQAASQTAVEQKAIQVRLNAVEERMASIEAQLAEERAGRAQDAAEYQQRLHAMESHFEAELNGRRALARRVAELAREVAEDRCARADDHQRLLKMETKGQAPPGFSEEEQPVKKPPSQRHKARSASPRGDVMLGSATDAELDVMLEEILEVIDAHEGQVLASNFPKCYYKVHGKPLNFKDLGYNKLSDLIRRLPGVYVEAGSHAFVRRAGVVEEAAPLDYDLPPLDSRVTEPFPAPTADAPPAPPAARLGFVPAATSGGAMSWSAVAAGAAP